MYAHFIAPLDTVYCGWMILLANHVESYSQRCMFRTQEVKVMITYIATVKKSAIAVAIKSTEL